MKKCKNCKVFPVVGFGNFCSYLCEYNYIHFNALIERAKLELYPPLHQEFMVDNDE